jgi:hypothetical protein
MLKTIVPTLIVIVTLSATIYTLFRLSEIKTRIDNLRQQPNSFQRITQRIYDVQQQDIRTLQYHFSINMLYLVILLILFILSLILINSI